MPKNSNLVYVVTMYRWGERENHSYVLGVFTKKHKAIKAADEEELCRGTKYSAEILRTPLNDLKVKDLGYKIIKDPTKPDYID